MIVGVPKETQPHEQRVALIPADLPALQKVGLQVQIESGCGQAAGYPDQEYLDKGATLAASRAELFAHADIIVQVRGLGSNLHEGMNDLAHFRKGQVLIGFQEPLWEPGVIAEQAGHGVLLLSMELMPRISRAQSMDALSAMANIAGYKAVLLAANTQPRMFPMLMTAAGTISPARVFVIGAGVAGLQAIATAKRLGAKVEAYDVRPVVRDQVESVGARFVELELDTQQAEGSGGYAKAMGEDFYRRQRELLAEVIAHNDVVISTAAIPGRPSPLLVTRAAVQGMRPGSVIVDLAAERGGNCELTRADEVVQEYNVTILGPTNLPATVPYHASQMYSRNVATFLKYIIKDKALHLPPDDEIVRDTLLTRDGEVVHSRVQSLLETTSPKT
ncbi:MAG: Re/Si-specific NAD(P)(+) transhydrogenase subunit alpha [Chloroflexaceae bacterium]|nr:Re/Si-specific NAD(P)(+) transhydrogenase subunit alpha [Chloroflexaceae bacterium]